MPTAIFVIILIAVFCSGVLVYQYLSMPSPSEIPPLPGKSVLKTEPIDLSNISTEKISLTKYYSLASLDVPLQVSQYKLPLKTNQIANFKDFSKKISLSDEALNLIRQNGFVVIKNPFNPNEEYITEPYKTLKDREIPVFITSDSLLHLYHIQFDETLRQIEEREFYDKIWEISKELFEKSLGEYEIICSQKDILLQSERDLKEAYKRNIAYFAVGLELLKPKEDQLCDLSEWECKDPGLASAYFTKEDLDKYKFEIPDFVKSDVEKELDLMEKHQGFSDSSIFIYKEDYSQYVPRGHYTRSEKLKNYFKAFMWYGRMSMLLKGTEQVKAGESCNNFPPCKAILSLYDAKIQTTQASLITSKFAESKTIKAQWDRIYSVTAFYVGLSDDLGPYEYLGAINFVFGDLFVPNDLTEEKIGELKAKLAEYRTPKIYGGTGEAKIWGPPFTPQQADELLGITQGFRLMGQRFIPDSYMFQNLVFPNVDSPLGPEKPFTWVMTDAGPTRGFPRGLDVMALLGSKRAKELLDELKDSNYERYDEQFNLLKQEFNGFSEADWNKNLYWSWLFSLRSLLKEFGAGYPSFMQTTAWQDKELTTALASWAELRHDTILYAKQSYTPTKMTAIMPPLEKPVVGYIEPVPEFYNRLLALTRMTTQGLGAMEVLDKTAKSRLENLEGVLEKLVELSKKELKNEELEKEDYEFIKNFGEQLNAVIADVDEKAKKTTIIVDVHTDQNTKQVLEEGVGNVNLIVVAYKVPDGRILIGAGPMMSYFEFKHPMKNRLTDEKWREMLSSEPPANPEWVSNFTE